MASSLKLQPLPHTGKYDNLKDLELSLFQKLGSFGEEERSLVCSSKQMDFYDPSVSQAGRGLGRSSFFKQEQWACQTDSLPGREPLSPKSSNKQY
mmetsp:Transcript_41671/g.63673  ORF Transcript_41671/g.63673 Transcript_41671/m.63673 type:complete len:95 (+) Transcript_41671:481-765(+)